MLPILTLQLVSAATALALQTGSAHLALGSPDILDPSCQSGLRPGWEIVTGTYDIAPEGFIDKMGSFFNFEWCSGFPPTRQIGTDNVPGATRYFDYFGGVFAERLVYYSRQSNKLEMSWRMDGPENITNSTVKPNGTLVIGGYTEALRVTSICGGSGTQVEFTGRYCADDLQPAFDIFRGQHGRGVENVTSELGAEEIDGKFDCP